MTEAGSYWEDAMNELSLWSGVVRAGVALATVVVFGGCAEPDPNHAHPWDEPTETTEKREPKPPAGPPDEGAVEADAPEALPQPKDKAPSQPEPVIVHADLGPEELVRHYLTRGAAGDLSRIRNFVDSRCHEGTLCAAWALV